MRVGSVVSAASISNWPLSSTLALRCHARWRSAWENKWRLEFSHFRCSIRHAKTSAALPATSARWQYTKASVPHALDHEGPKSSSDPRLFHPGGERRHRRRDGQLGRAPVTVPTLRHHGGNGLGDHQHPRRRARRTSDPGNCRTAATVHTRVRRWDVSCRRGGAYARAARSLGTCGTAARGAVSECGYRAMRADHGGERSPRGAAKA